MTDELLCGHCGKPQRGYAMVNGVRLCHPTEGMDCYRLVTVYDHKMPCDQHFKDDRITYRTYLYTQVMLEQSAAGTHPDLMLTMEAVSSTAIEHPEWPMDEKRTWEEWEAWEKTL